ncbi:MAG: ATP-binding cassette domain-containing protein, partial [Woeseiaceae bacterium]|nr:ATP-binding cassette domain-containing protein [Woeseiaceae bacterium]
FLAFTAELRGMRGEAKKRAVHRAVEVCFLESVLHQSVETLSKGYRHRTCFAQSIIHDPDVLVLDEPTDGLDPNQKHEVRQLIQSMARDKLIVISTHILEEVEAVCSRAIIISAGRILADDTPHNLAAQSRYHNAVRLGAPDAASIGAIEAAIARLPSVSTTETDRQHLTITALARIGGKDGEVLRQVSQLITEKGWNVTGLQLESGRLDEVFRQITGGARA